MYTVKIKLSNLVTESKIALSTVSRQVTLSYRYFQIEIVYLCIFKRYESSSFLFH